MSLWASMLTGLGGSIYSPTRVQVWPRVVCFLSIAKYSVLVEGGQRTAGASRSCLTELDSGSPELRALI